MNLKPYDVIRLSDNTIDLIFEISDDQVVLFDNGTVPISDILEVVDDETVGNVFWNWPQDR
jgi:hypothetical protein